MPIYIFKNDQQTGPFEDHIIIDQLKGGLLSGSDMAIRHGGTQWQPLSELFPDAVKTPEAPPPIVPPDQPSPFVSPSTTPPPMYRKTMLQKIVFGLAFLLSIAAFGIAAFNVRQMMGPSGDLEADLANMAVRTLVRDAAIGLFLLCGLAFLALLLTFKRKIIRSNGLRLVMRVFFVLVLLAGIAQAAYAAASYLQYSPPTTPAGTSTADASNPLLEALDRGDRLAGPYKAVAFHLPIAAGLVLFGLSGFLMTTRRGSEKRAES